MKIYEGLSGPFHISQPVVTTGTFDGVHIGHRKIIQRIRQLSEVSGGESVLITFEPHPRLLLFPEDNNLKLLNSREEKIRLLKEAGVQNLIIIPFTKEFSRLTSLEYIRDILLEKLGMNMLVIGYDHHFGRNREGSIDQLKEYSAQFGFGLEEIPAQDIDDIKVSSTKIRNALLSGDVTTAWNYLTYPYPLSGIVTHGDKKGRTMNYPTANILPDDPLKLIPALGVYAVKVTIGEQLMGGMLNIGHRPTVNGGEIRIEVHIFEWEKEIYGERIQVEFMERLRDEMKFSGLEELKNQLDKDKVKAKQILTQHEEPATRLSY